MDPLNARCWESLAQTEYSMGRLDQSAADIKKSLELKPDDPFFHNLLSQIYIMQRRPQDALLEIERVNDPRWRLYLDALAFHELGQKKEADAALTELIEKHKNTDENLIAKVYAFRNQPDEAFEWLDRAYARHNDG